MENKASGKYKKLEYRVKNDKNPEIEAPIDEIKVENEQKPPKLVNSVDKNNCKCTF